MDHLKNFQSLGMNPPQASTRCFLPFILPWRRSGQPEIHLPDKHSLEPFCSMNGGEFDHLRCPVCGTGDGLAVRVNRNPSIVQIGGTSLLGGGLVTCRACQATVPWGVVKPEENAELLIYVASLRLFIFAATSRAASRRYKSLTIWTSSEESSTCLRSTLGSAVIASPLDHFHFLRV